MKQPLLRLRPLSVSLLLSLVFVFNSVNSLDNSYDEESALKLSQPECGIPDIEPKVDSRIVGGVEARPHSWPWMVSIKFRDLNWAHGCGGSVLNSRWVITAAHCVEYGGPADYKIVLGEHNLTKKEETEQKFKIDKIIVHEEYNNNKLFNNDIALIRLPKDARLNRYVKPICLPDVDVKDGKLYVVTGWGYTIFTGDETVLNQVYLPVISNKKCNQRRWYGGRVTDNMICAYYDKGGKDACKGDSGGPLAGLSKGKWTLFGLTSWSKKPCSSPEYPAVYTRVMNYIDWIREKTEQCDY